MEATLSQDRRVYLQVASKGFQFLRWIDQVFKSARNHVYKRESPYQESDRKKPAMLFTIHSLAALAATVILPQLTSAAPAVRKNGTCRVLPGDADYPLDEEWEKLNRTVGGRLIRGVPLAEESCYSTNVSATSAGCAKVQNEWANLAPLYA